MGDLGYALCGGLRPQRRQRCLAHGADSTGFAHSAHGQVGPIDAGVDDFDQRDDCGLSIGLLHAHASADHHLHLQYRFSGAQLTHPFGTGVLPIDSDAWREMWRDAIVSLILHCIVPDQEVFFKSLAEESWILGVLVLLFILLGSLTVMNMLLGVLVEAVKTVSTIEQEQMMADFARKVLCGLIQDDTEMQEVDYQQRMISEKEFKSLLRKPRAVKALPKLGVDAGAALDYGRMLFEDDESVSFVEFMHAMLTLRGSNKATVKDIVELRKYIGEEFTQIRSVLSELCTFIGDTLWTSTD